MKFTLCENCGVEVMVSDGNYFDYEYPNRNHPNGYKEAHDCPNKRKNYQTNGITMHG